MSRKKKKNRHNDQHNSAPFTSSSAPAPALPALPPAPITHNFDAAEDRIRGEEIMMKGDLKKAKETHQVKKALDDQEVDRRLEELRRQLGLNKK